MNRTTNRPRRALGWAMAVSLVAATPALANLSRNTSSANTMGETGELVVDTAGQWERDPDGKTWLIELAAQYAFTNRIEAVLESAVYERLEPEDGGTVSGVGDMDLILSYLLLGGDGPRPAVVVGGKVKLPTASEDLGTGKADYSALAVLGKEWDKTDLNLELEYAAFGSPADEDLKDQFIYTLALDRDLTEHLAAYAEAFGNTKPTEEESGTNAALFGLELDIPVNDTVTPYVSLEIDTEEVSTARLGAEWTW